VAYEDCATALENTAELGHLPGDLTDTYDLGERVCEAQWRFDPIPGKPGGGAALPIFNFPRISPSSNGTVRGLSSH
jgi:hypothetical protein